MRRASEDLVLRSAALVGQVRGPAMKPTPRTTGANENRCFARLNMIHSAYLLCSLMSRYPRSRDTAVAVQSFFRGPRFPLQDRAGWHSALTLAGRYGCRRQKGSNG
jgi:hypothetical protein